MLLELRYTQKKKLPGKEKHNSLSAYLSLISQADFRESRHGRAGYRQITKSQMINTFCSLIMKIQPQFKS